MRYEYIGLGYEFKDKIGVYSYIGYEFKDNVVLSIQVQDMNLKI